MDGRRFDAWSRVAGAASSRRAVVRLVGALAVGGAGLGLESAEAACYQGGHICRRTQGSLCCSGQCSIPARRTIGRCTSCKKKLSCTKPSTCGPNGTGACFRTLDGTTACFLGEFGCNDYPACGSSGQCSSGLCASTCCGLRCVPLWFDNSLTTAAARPGRGAGFSSK